MVVHVDYDDELALAEGEQALALGAPSAPPAGARVLAQLRGAGLACNELRLGRDFAAHGVAVASAASALVHLATPCSPDAHRVELAACELAVLDAADAFDGDLRVDGFVRVARAFLAAGARSVALPLWAADCDDDDATAELMAQFYARRCGPEGLDTAAAMRGAMRAMIAAGWTPRQWAPFVVYGLCEDARAGPEIAETAPRLSS